MHKVKDYELKQLSKAKERQAIFEEAFETEIKQYKEFGTIPSKTLLVLKYSTNFHKFLNKGLSLSNRQTISLEEITVDDDPSSLNEFLDE